MSTRTVLVTGATGNQGKAVIAALLDQGHKVRALVRKEGEGPSAWKAQGVEAVTGDFEDFDSLVKAMAGMDAAFAMTTPSAGVELEVRQGKLLADAAQAASVGHLVYSSVADADRRTGIPHFDSKFEVEQHIRGLDIPWTITAPVYFYDNALFPWNMADLGEGRLRQVLKPSRKLQQIAVRDIGRFNALVIDRKDSFIGKRINIAGDEVTGEEMAKAFSDATGRAIAFQEQALEEVAAQFADVATMYAWFDRDGFTADISSLRSDYPEVDWLSFREWTAAQDWSQAVPA